ncbi:AI-2E family transporter [Ginsengibacter hankyongi]|uniref:AI-2E family transporter n=1 Tax=Ginsengibacter hankyongi TaxID=2607284 RepID=A0A5J5IDL3_9BACT|nr:AI-2E family transporter [Ginsengibacter hankyongi]KAA9036630.1 AI-2E family transporter [Ginsengibacter hankyongi]
MEKKYPFYFRSTVTLFGIMLFVYMLFVLKSILIPLAFAMMIAILLNPLVNKLQQKKIPKVISIVIALVVALLFVAGLMFFVSSQVAKLSSNMSALELKFSELFRNLQLWFQQHYSLSLAKQKELLAQAGDNLKPLITQTLGTVLGTLSVIVLLPVYIFLILFYKTLILNFLYEVFAERNSTKVGVVLKQTKSAIQSYMIGLLLEAIVVAALNSGALLILGVQYAILLGVIGAILNVLPYIGGLIAIALPIIIATITKEGYSTQIEILIAYLLIQFIDNNILVPRIVSSKVKINALVSLVIVLLGGAVWGLSGMFLSIPFIAVLKIIFDRVDELKPWGKILGDEVPVYHKGQLWNLRKRRKKSLSEQVTSNG